GLSVLGLASLLLLMAPAAAAGRRTPPQGTQSNAAYAASFAASHVINVFATTQRVSCYRPEVPYFVSDGPNDGYSGMSACPGATTGEDTGQTPYPTQVGSNPGYPANRPMLVKNHSESDLRVDPTNPNHLIGSSKWVVSAEGTTTCSASTSRSTADGPGRCRATSPGTRAGPTTPTR